MDNDDDLLQYVEEIPSNYLSPAAREALRQQALKPEPKAPKPNSQLQDMVVEGLEEFFKVFLGALAFMGALFFFGVVVPKKWETQWKPQWDAYQIEREAARRLKSEESRVENAQRELEIQQAVERLRSNQ